MANQLDELNGPIMEQGHDVNVVAKQIPVKVGWGSKFFQVILWFPLIIPGIIFLLKKIKAKTYLRQLEQKIQQNASTIDNYLEQRVVILSNLAGLVNKAVELDKETFVGIAAARGGNGNHDDAMRNEIGTAMENVNRNINVALENYPELKAHQEIQDAIQQNSYLQREITAARELYNDSVATWNKEIQIWPVKMIAAAEEGYTTRVPFIASKEIKEKARDVFF